jgi:hypothetical protein
MIIPFKNLENFSVMLKYELPILSPRKTKVGQSDTWILTDLLNTSTMGWEKHFAKKNPALMAGFLLVF